MARAGGARAAGGSRVTRAGVIFEKIIGAEHETKGDDCTGASGTTIRDARPGSIASE